MIIRKCIVLCTTISCLLYAFIPIGAFAEDQSGSGMISMLGVGTNDRGYFEIEAKPGQKRSVTVNLKNASDKVSADGLMFVSDAPVAAGGGMGTLPPDKALRQDIGGWFQMTEESVSLAPGESRDVVLNFDIPSNASPGDHVGQVVLYKLLTATPEKKKLQANESQLYLNKAYNQAIAVQVKIPGIIAHRMILRSLSPHWTGTDAFLDLTVANDGNAIEQSKGTIILSQNGKTLYTKDGELGSIYPGTAGLFSFSLPAELRSSGTYNTDVLWTYSGQSVHEKFTYTIEQDDVKNAERVLVANQQAEKGKTLSTKAIILQPEMLINLGIILVAVIMLFVVLIFLIRRKKRKKYDENMTYLSNDEIPTRSKKQKRSGRPYPASHMDSETVNNRSDTM
jgi:hypothetical protein